MTTKIQAKKNRRVSKKEQKVKWPSTRKIFDTFNYFMQPFIAIAVFYIAILQYKQAQKQSQMSQVQTEIAIAQETLDLHMFVREYINGFVYLYDVGNAESVESIIKEIRERLASSKNFFTAPE